MGLDMYLMAKKFLWDSDKSAKKKVNSIYKLKELDINYLEFEFIYWRKANAIHKWFVENVQDGEDECQAYYVPIEKLQQLLDLINKVLSNKGKASELLPTQSGFFFGSVEYDDYYFQDLEMTKKKLDWLFSNIEEMKSFEFYYHSSW